jgi:hypothetical protein
MPSKSLEQEFALPSLNSSRLSRFKKARLEAFCVARCIQVPQTEGRGPLKPDFVQAILAAVSEEQNLGSWRLIIEYFLGRC